MWTPLLLLSILFGFAFTFNGLRLNHHYLWLAGVFFYFASFIGSLSIGLYVLVLPILLWSFAIASSLKWVKKTQQYLYFAPIGLAIWLLAITQIDDYYLFYPINWLM